MYDNNSSDGTDKIAEAAGAIVRYEYQQGKGNVIRRMFREIDAEYYIMTDGDGTYPAGSARRMADLVLNKKVDMVVVDRLSTEIYGKGLENRTGVVQLIHWNFEEEACNVKDIM